MRKYNKKNITLQIRVPVDMAISIVGRLYGCGVINKQQYLEKIEKIDVDYLELEKKKEERLNKIFNKGLKNEKSNS